MPYDHSRFYSREIYGGFVGLDMSRVNRASARLQIMVGTDKGLEEIGSSKERDGLRICEAGYAERDRVLLMPAFIPEKVSDEFDVNQRPESGWWVERGGLARMRQGERKDFDGIQVDRSRERDEKEIQEADELLWYPGDGIDKGVVVEESEDDTDEDDDATIIAGNNEEDEDEELLWYPAMGRGGGVIVDDFDEEWSCETNGDCNRSNKGIDNITQGVIRNFAAFDCHQAQATKLEQHNMTKPSGQNRSTASAANENEQYPSLNHHLPPSRFPQPQHRTEHFITNRKRPLDSPERLFCSKRR